MGVCREFTATLIADALGFVLPFLACLPCQLGFVLCLKCVSASAVQHSEEKSDTLSLWGIGGVGGSCFNSGLGW